MAAEQLIEARQQYYILATELSVAERTYVIKRGQSLQRALASPAFGARGAAV